MSCTKYINHWSQVETIYLYTCVVHNVDRIATKEIDDQEMSELTIVYL